MVTKIDQITGLVYEVKRPAETRKYTVDFTKVVASGVTISTVQSVGIAKLDNVIEIAELTAGSITISGTKVSFDVTGGTDGEDYEVTINCTDTSGDILSDDVMIKVRKAGGK